jgi:acyl dehydratase
LDIDKLKTKLGTGSESVAYDIEKGMIQRFVRAINDPNPRWQVVAPPTLLLTIGLERIQQQLLDSLPSATILHGSTELECYQPVKPGDTIAVNTTIANIRERQGKMGKTAFITFDTAYKNQRQEPVARCRQMVITY